MDKNEAQQVFDGAMLSDGRITPKKGSHNARFDMRQTVDHADWLYDVKEAFKALGIRVPCMGVATSQGWGRKLQMRLSTGSSPYLTLQRHRWYGPNGERLVPGDLILTPVTLANWFAGDGSTSWDSRNANLAHLGLSTVRFGLEGNLQLQALLLRDLGIELKVWRTGREGEFCYLGAGRIATINRFLDIVELHLPASFLYKVKRPYLLRPPA